MKKLFIVAAFAALPACSPKAEAPAEPAAATPATEHEVVLTPSNPYFGTWKVSSAVVAPWWDKKGATPKADPEFESKPVVFDAAAASGPAITTCSKPKYAVDLVAPEGLFEGNLSDAQKQSAELGFHGEITQLTYSCTDDQRDVSLAFPMIDDDTIALGLDNMIYTLKRSK